MRAIKNINQIDFLWDNGVKPLYERFGVAYYKSNKELRLLLDRYFIIHSCIPNRGY
jgi:hypothetical protein